MEGQMTTLQGMLEGPPRREPPAETVARADGEHTRRRFWAETGAVVMNSLRKIGEYIREGIHQVRALFARPVGSAALEGANVDKPEGTVGILPVASVPGIPHSGERMPTAGVWQGGRLVPSEHLSFSPVVSEQRVPPSSIPEANRGAEERRPVQYGIMLLMIKAREVRLMREQGDAHAPSDDELLTYFLAKTEGEWHWDDRAINRAFDAFSRVLYPDAVAPIADGVGAAAVVAPYRQDTVETARDPRRWILAGALGVAALIAAGLGLQALTNDHPRPPVPAASSPTPTVSPARPTPSPTPPETDNDNGPSLPPGELQVQTRLKGAEADKNGDFVRMTSYADRHEARAKGEDFSTVWWIAREQLDAVNGSATPTNRQIWEFTDQTLDHNDLTWDEARRLRAEQKIRLLSDAAAQKVISR